MWGCVRPDSLCLFVRRGGHAVYCPLVRPHDRPPGKVRTFRWLAVAAVVPMVATTLTEGWPLAAVLVVSTLLFMCMSGRMIPGMAIITSAANPALRGTFMTLNCVGAVGRHGRGGFRGRADHWPRRPGACRATTGWRPWWECWPVLLAIWLAGRLNAVRQAPGAVEPERRLDKFQAEKFCQCIANQLHLGKAIGRIVKSAMQKSRFAGAVPPQRAVFFNPRATGGYL
jgi:hypothetical protein